MKQAARQGDLFGAANPQLPEGMVYEPDFLGLEEERAWIDVAASLPLKEMDYRGYTARRRVASYEPAASAMRRRIRCASSMAPACSAR